MNALIKWSSKILLSILLFAVACSVDDGREVSHLTESSTNLRLGAERSPVMPDINPTKLYQNLYWFTPIESWRDVLTYHNYTHFSFRNKHG